MRLNPCVGLGVRVLLAVAIAILGGAPTRAQAPARAPTPAQAGVSASELNPNARLPRAAPPRDQDIFAPEPPGPCPLAGSLVQITLKSVTLRGSTAVPAGDFAPAYTEYLSAPQPVAVLCAIRDRAQRILFDAGVLARVEIPEQRISDGALVLDVIEAQVVNVRVRGDIGPAQGVVERYVEKLRGMKPFDMRRAQRYLLLASDIPGVRVRAAVRPSTVQTRGAVDIDVTVTRDSVDLIGSVQNYGSTEVGRWGGLVRGDLMSQTAYGERSSLTAFRTLEANEQWVVQAVEEARFGGEGLVGRASAVYGESRPGGGLKALGLHSKSFVTGLEASYPLLRSRRANINLAPGFELINQRTRAAGIGPFSDDRLRVLYLRAEGDLLTRALGRPLQLDGSLTLRKGLSGLGASAPGDILRSRGLAQPDAWALRGAGSADMLIAPSWIASLQVQGQYADRPLFAYEQMSLGDLGIGRGYDPAAVLGDSGLAWAFELRHAPVQLHPKVQVQPFLFYDYGEVWNHDPFLQRRRVLRAAGAGVNLRLAGRANLAVTYAHPFDPVIPGARRPDERVLVRLTASFY